VRKKYAATRSFAVKKAPETPAEGIKDSLQAMLKGKKPAQQSAPTDAAAQAKKADDASAPAKKPSALRTAIIIAVALFLLFFLAIGLLVIQYGGEAGGVPPSASPTIFSGTYSSQLAQSMLLSVGQVSPASRAGYFLIDFDSENVTSANFTAQIYREKPLTQVFVLDHVRESADSYAAFHAGLSERLSRQGIPLNDIGIESLQNLPEGALLIVPTGYFPTGLLSADNSTNYKSMLSRGVDILYIGLPFDSLALDKSGSTIPISNSDITFSKTRPETTDGLLLFDAQYVASPGKASSGGLMSTGGALYGSVSSLRLGNGVMLFVPQFLDGGWVTDSDTQGYEKAASDIARIIKEERWASPVASASSNLTELSGKDAVSLYTGSFPGDYAFAKVAVDAMDQGSIAARSFSVLRVEKTQKGEITPRDSQTVPFYLSGQKTRLNLALHENDSTPLKLFVAMYKDGVELQRSEFELGLTNPTIERSVDFQVNAEPGAYVLTIVDGSGKVYAATMLTVIDMDIVLSAADWQNGRFNFTLSSGSKPVSPQSLSVALDGTGEQQYGLSSLSRSPSSTSLTYAYFGKLQPGKHKFTFTVGSWNKDFEAEYFQRKNFWENPTVIFLAVISLLVFGAGTILRRPEVLKYGLDVPDFPPLSTIKIPLKRETVLEIFDNVNAGYSWKWMPLRSEELKGGFRKLTYNGKPILIGDFNLERVLSKLREEGQVKDELDYWGKTSWEKESNHSIRYLMIYRILRNVFVNNAVKFSKLDAIPECDVKAVLGNEEIYLHIMEEPAERVVHRALATVTKGHTIIVFKTPEEVEDFSRTLNSSSKLAVALKMEVNNRNIMLLPVKEAISAYLKGKTA